MHRSAPVRFSGVVGSPSPGVQEIEVEGALGLFDPSSDRVLMLNNTASDVWRLSDGQHTLDEVLELLARAYGVDAAEIQEDVLSALESFRRHGLLTPEVQEESGRAPED